MMSTGENVKLRTAPNQESARPLSTYDNLNNDTKLNACENNDTIQRTENVNEFPFSGISFRFDELKQLNQNTTPIVHTSSNGYDNINNNNYKSHRNINSNVNNNSHMNGNGVNQIRGHQGHTVTTIAQNHSTSSSPTNSSSSTSESSSSSSENSYKHSSLQYANLAENPIVNRSIINKPVHSPAKSQFLGLHKTNDNNESNILPENRMNGVTMTKKCLEKNGRDERDNAGESSTMSEDEPLLNGYGSRIVPTGLNRTNASVQQYQNIPSNSSCYGQNQIDEANECTCTCKDNNPGTEIRQYESDHYKCNGCLNRISSGAPINVIPISSMNVPTCSKTVDLASSPTSMKPAKSTTLDTSSSFRMNQSSLSQVQNDLLIRHIYSLFDKRCTLSLFALILCKECVCVCICV